MADEGPLQAGWHRVLGDPADGIPRYLHGRRQMHATTRFHRTQPYDPPRGERPGRRQRLKLRPHSRMCIDHTVLPARRCTRLPRIDTWDRRSQPALAAHLHSHRSPQQSQRCAPCLPPACECLRRCWPNLPCPALRRGRVQLCPTHNNGLCRHRGSPIESACQEHPAPARAHGFEGRRRSAGRKQGTRFPRSTADLRCRDTEALSGARARFSAPTSQEPGKTRR